MDRPIKLAFGRALHAPGPPELNESYSRSCTALVPISEDQCLVLDASETSSLPGDHVNNKGSPGSSATTHSSPADVTHAVHPVLSRAQYVSTSLPPRRWNAASDTLLHHHPSLFNLRLPLISPPMEEPPGPEPVELAGSLLIEAPAASHPRQKSQLHVQLTPHPWAVPALGSIIIKPPPRTDYPPPQARRCSRRSSRPAGNRSASSSASSAYSAGLQYHHRRNRTPQAIREVERRLENSSMSPCPPYTEWPNPFDTTSLHTYDPQHPLHRHLRNDVPLLTTFTGVLAASTDKEVLTQPITIPAYVDTPAEYFPSSLSGSSCYSPVGIISELESPLSEAALSSASSKAYGSSSSSTSSSSSSSALEEIIEASADSASAKESLKRKLSHYRKAYDENPELRRENTRLRKLSDTKSKRISDLEQAKETLEQANETLERTNETLEQANKAHKDEEHSLKNSIISLETRLESANTDRVDILDGFDQACNLVNDLMARQKSLTEELEEARSQLARATRFRVPDSPSGSRTPAMGSERPMRSPSPLQGMEMPHSTIRGQRSQEVLAASPLSPLRSPQSDKAVGLEKRLAETQDENMRLTDLLVKELRRQSRLTAQKEGEKKNNKNEKDPSCSPRVEADAAAEFTETTRQIQAQAAAATRTTISAARGDESKAARVNQLLERELQRCIKEMVLFKLDVSGYKKDLKKANARIRDLQTQQQQQQASSSSSTAEQIDAAAAAAATAAAAAVAVAARPTSKHPYPLPPANLPLPPSHPLYSAHSQLLSSYRASKSSNGASGLGIHVSHSLSSRPHSPASEPPAFALKKAKTFGPSTGAAAASSSHASSSPSTSTPVPGTMKRTSLSVNKALPKIPERQRQRQQQQQQQQHQQPKHSQSYSNSQQRSRPRSPEEEERIPPLRPARSSPLGRFEVSPLSMKSAGAAAAFGSAGVGSGEVGRFTPSPSPGVGGEMF